VELLDNIRTYHPISHINQLKLYRIKEGDPNRIGPFRSPALIVDKLELEVEKILAHKTTYFGNNQRHK
jgi:hypothetical protein